MNMNHISLLPNEEPKISRRLKQPNNLEWMNVAAFEWCDVMRQMKSSVWLHKTARHAPFFQMFSCIKYTCHLTSTYLYSFTHLTYFKYSKQKQVVIQPICFVILQQKCNLQMWQLPKMHHSLSVYTHKYIHRHSHLRSLIQFYVFNCYLLTLISVEGQGKFCHLQNISGASQQNSVAAFS